MVRLAKPYQHRFWLFRHYVGMQLSVNDIARRCGVTYPTILHWLDKHEIEKRPCGGVASYAPYRDEKWLREQYIEHGRTVWDIAAEFDLTEKSVRTYLSRFHITKG